METSVQIRHDTGDLGIGTVRGQCVNISECGLMIQLPCPIPLLSEVSFDLEDLSFQGTATVRHCGHIGGYSMVGLEFNDGLRFDSVSG